MIPKAELHLHLEGGAVLPSIVKKLAKKHKIKLPGNLFGKGETFAWSDFFDFIKKYDVVANTLRTPEDYYDVTYAYLEHSAKQGVIYSELGISPSHALANGLTYHDILEGVTLAMDQAKHDYDIESRLIIMGVRHEGAEVVESVVKQMINDPHPHVVGLGLGGDELNFPPAQFSKAFKMAQEAGFGCKAHAGEIAGPESIWEAINALPITRIGHGIRCIEDPYLVDEILTREITLEICPTSNIILKVYPSFEEYPFKELWKRGVKLTLNSDDPFFFATTIGQEYKLAKEKFSLSNQDLITMTKTAIQNSFADKITKEELLQKIEQKR